MRSAWLAAILVVTPLWAQTSPVGGQSRDAQTTTPAGSASVTGVVQIAINRQTSPVRRARVTLRNEGGAVHTTDTDTQGQFRFAQLSGGTYKILVDKPGFVPLGREPIVELKDGQITKVTALMQRGAAIEGRLVNASGEPAMGLTVAAIRLGFGPYGKKVVAWRQTTTDDLGRFRLHTLLPGEYYIEAAPDPLRMLGASPAPGQIPSRRTYYPGTSRLNEAQVVAIAAEQQLDNVTFPMTDAALTLVTATVSTASGQPPAVFSVRVQRAGAPPGEVRCVLLQGKPGAFQCPNVPPGDFWFLVAARAAPEAGVEFAAVRTTIEGRDLDLAVPTAPGASVTGRVEVEGGVPLPPNVQIAALETEFELPGPTPTASTSGTPPITVGADGTFTFTSVIGRRLFRFTRLPDGWAVKSVFLEAVDIVDTPTAFDPAERPVLRVVLTPRTGSVEGNVLGSDAKPAAGARVVVYSDDARHWTARSRFVRSVEVGASGRYVVAGLLPGQYHVAFVELLDDGAWEDPDVLGRLRTLATPIVITGTERVTLNGRMR